MIGHKVKVSSTSVKSTQLFFKVVWHSHQQCVTVLPCFTSLPTFAIVSLSNFSNWGQGWYCIVILICIFLGIMRLSAFSDFIHPLGSFSYKDSSRSWLQDFLTLWFWFEFLLKKNVFWILNIYFAVCMCFLYNSIRNDLRKII